MSEWRKVAIRSSRARAFSTKVRAAYGHRCVVTGDALPKLPSTAGPGVDAAHILPWSRYELNSISNGLCLNKLWHWAFDAGTIRIDFAEDQGEYTVSVPDQVESEAKENGFSLDHFLWHQGAIDESRLPADSDDWPSPTYLNQLNEEMFGLGVSG